MGNLIKFILLLSLGVSIAFSSSCPPQKSTEDSLQLLISVVDQINGDGKVINSEEKIFVEGLNKEKFNEISNNPDQIAKIMGAELLEVKSSNEFQLKIPGILGFDLTFWATTKKDSDDSINVTLNRFNTFFIKGKGELTFVPSGNSAYLKMKGSAVVPNSASNIFIFSVGGKANFESMLQKEMDKQIKLSLERYRSFVE